VAKLIAFEFEQELSSDEEALELPSKKKRKGNIANSNGLSRPVSALMSDHLMIEEPWSKEDEVVLQKTSMEEQKLWRWRDAIFGISPPELLPERARNIAIDLKDITDPDDASKICKNTNWATDFCTSLATIICCPAFCAHVQLFQYVLLVIYYRLGVTRY
jgi:hypothetical protein